MQKLTEVACKLRYYP